VAREVKDVHLILFNLRNLGTHAYQEGDLEAAQRFLGEAVEVARELDRQEGIAASLHQLGQIAFYQGKSDVAKALHAESLTVARASGQDEAIASVFAGQAEMALAAGDLEAARDLFRTSLSYWQRVPEPPVLKMFGSAGGVAFCLEGLAGVSMFRNEPRRAAALLGAAESLRESRGMPIPAPSRPNRDDWGAAVRSALCESEFDAEWEEGRAMTLEEAIGYALEAPSSDGEWGYRDGACG
jgi:tetratricopeptide (TPR) repeat protein